MFFAIGFETTAPSTALTLMRAKAEGIRNFSVFCNHVTIIPAIRAILDSPDMRLDAFIGPGHVSTVIGCRPYEWIAPGRAQADRGLRLRAARHAAVDRDAAAPIERRRRQGREPVQARGPLGRQSRGAARPWPRFSSCVRTSNGAAWDSSRNRRCAFATATPSGTRSSASTSGRTRDRPQGSAVRRSTEGRAEAAPVQTVWQASARRSIRSAR